jgi:hypothetical protein
MDWLDPASFEIRGTLDDNVHSLTARLVVGFPDFTIRAAAGEITRMPYEGYCTGATAAITTVVGERIGRGFKKRLAEAIGGAESCNHLYALVNDMATCAFQMNYMAAKRRPEALKAMREMAGDHATRRETVLTWMPQLRDSCYVFSRKNDHLFRITTNESETTGEN